MYILHETVAGNDPRLHPAMQVFGTYWHYTVTYIPDDVAGSVYYDWLKPEVISEDVAKAYKFTGASNNELTVKKSASNWEELATASGESLSGHGEKFIYELTTKDRANCVSFLKAMIKNYVTNRVEDADKRNSILQLLTTVRSIDECRAILLQNLA